jgi:hypothetical protein
MLGGRQVLGVFIEKDKRLTTVQSFAGPCKIESFDEGEIVSVSKIIAAVHR